MKRIAILLVPGVIALSGCVSLIRPVLLDAQGVDVAHYEKNLAECQNNSLKASLALAAIGGALDGIFGGVFAPRGVPYEPSQLPPVDSLIRDCMLAQGYNVQ